MTKQEQDKYLNMMVNGLINQAERELNDKLPEADRQVVVSLLMPYLDKYVNGEEKPKEYNEDKDII